ncbi:viroplasmin family protein, partial [Clostridium sporogenes]|uniref:ribonuclease H1 domain-containing protein n=1 Tax=Clostridium sporogenes TaxID=1509 RepID=UPI0007736648
MSQKKYYAVKVGRKTGIFDNWNECKEQIQGYSGAIYKGFSNYEDAYKFLNGGIKNTITNKKDTKKIEAYVDGSYSDEYNEYSYGCVILYENEIIKFSGVGSNKEYISMRNVAGELLGAMKAVEWAYENEHDSIIIYHDYEGIDRWANGIWKTNKQGTKEYLEFIKKYRKYLEISY